MLYPDLLIDGQLPESWTKFLKAVLKKDYAIGYLLLTLLGRSTLVLTHLMSVLMGGNVTVKVCSMLPAFST